jgi:membrane-bound acyltransferase YfiQ involved in biofilm formation
MFREPYEMFKKLPPKRRIVVIVAIVITFTFWYFVFEWMNENLSEETNKTIGLVVVVSGALLLPLIKVKLEKSKKNTDNDSP